MLKEIRRVSVLALAALLLPLNSHAQNLPQTSQTKIQITRAEENQNYQNALKFARLGDEIKAQEYLAKTYDKSLAPIILRELILSQKTQDKNLITSWLEKYNGFNGAQTIYEIATRANIANLKQPVEIPNHAKFAQLKQPKEITNQRAPNATQQEAQNLKMIAALFRANRDNEAAKLALSQINGSYAGLAAWYGGLAAYRSGDFDTAFILFSITAHWQYGDDYTHAQGAFWAARTAQKLGKKDYQQYFLQKAANSPLSFYGQLALMGLGKWDELPVPTLFDEANGAKKLINNDGNVKNALWLYELGETNLSKDELEFAWRKNNNANDLSFLYLANALGFDELAGKIAGDNDFGAISRAYPIVDITPNGGSFVLDRALIFAIMRQESRFNANAISYAGARGLMQLMPATAAWLAKSPSLKSNPNILHNQKLNVTLGENYLEYVLSLNVTDGSVARALMAYNAGPGNVNKWKNRAENSEDTLMFIEATPNQQARDYVKKVMTNLWIYHKRLGQNAPTLEKLAFDKAPIYEPQDNPRQSQKQFELLASSTK